MTWQDFHLVWKCFLKMKRCSVLGQWWLFAVASTDCRGCLPSWVCTTLATNQLVPVDKASDACRLPASCLILQCLFTFVFLKDFLFLTTQCYRFVFQSQVYSEHPFRILNGSCLSDDSVCLMPFMTVSLKMGFTPLCLMVKEIMH